MSGMWRVDTARVRGHSPLRYPGGKSSLYGFLNRELELNDLVGGTYVEPYAGGAGSAIALLATNRVEQIVVNDLDPAIHAFWHSVTQESAHFRRMVLHAKLDLVEWRTQREVYQKGNVNDLLGLGFAAFYLNRTNRSGVMNAGVIGGQQQSGTYRIDARFNKTELVKRLDAIAALADRMTVLSKDGVEVIKQYCGEERTLVYADPPYFDKGSVLYMNSFDDSQHAALARELNSKSSAKWILTYDNQAAIRALYPDRRTTLFDLHYSAHTVGKAHELMIVSDSLVV